jgi:hypothetical protein
LVDAGILETSKSIANIQSTSSNVLLETNLLFFHSAVNQITI